MAYDSPLIAKVDAPNAEHLLRVGEQTKQLLERQSTCKILWDECKFSEIVHGNWLATDGTGIIVAFRWIKGRREAGEMMDSTSPIQILRGEFHIANDDVDNILFYQGM